MSYEDGQGATLPRTLKRDAHGVPALIATGTGTGTGAATTIPTASMEYGARSSSAGHLYGVYCLTPPLPQMHLMRGSEGPQHDWLAAVSASGRAL